MDTIFSFTLRGTKAANEDVFGRAGSYAWMIDGATDVFPDRHFASSDSQFLARLVSFELATHVDGFPALPEDDPASLMKEALSFCSELATELDPTIEEVPAYTLPSFAFMLVQDRYDGTIEAAALCDCHLFMDTGTHFTDTRFTSIVERNRRAIAALEHDTPEARQKIFQDTRKLMNREDGYWVGTLDGQGLAHVARARINAPAGTRIALASDGFVAALEQEAKDSTDIFAAIPKAAAHLAASCSQKDASEHRDDASVLVVEV